MKSVGEAFSYVVLARKWRPAQFADIVGQGHVVRTLMNAIKSNRIHQAYLFTGSRGIGKTSIARIFAKAIRCEQAKTEDSWILSCGTCSCCKEIASGNSVDVIEIDGASNNGVEAVREIRENAKYMPSTGARKIYIIDEVHMLTTAAFNALLKTLEEPPAHVIFMFATTEPHKIPATILSRCQRFDFRRVTQAQAQQRFNGWPNWPINSTLHSVAQKHLPKIRLPQYLRRFISPPIEHQCPHMLDQAQQFPLSRTREQAPISVFMNFSMFLRCRLSTRYG